MKERCTVQGQYGAPNSKDEGRSSDGFDSALVVGSVRLCSQGSLYSSVVLMRFDGQSGLQRVFM
eukprot:2012790-Rhodomonas_salina.1